MGQANEHDQSFAGHCGISAMSGPFLVMCDIDGVQRWLLRSVHLREIAGASQLLSDFDEKVAQIARSHDGDALFARGGTALITFDSADDAELFRSKAANELTRSTVSATMTTSRP